MPETVYAAAAGRDLMIVVELEMQQKPFTYVVYACDGDGNPLFTIAATTNGFLVTAMLPTWTAMAVERQQQWQRGSEGLWTGWPTTTETNLATRGHGTERPLYDDQTPLRWVKATSKQEDQS